MQKPASVAAVALSPYNGPVILASGHRLFFLAAGVYGTVAMLAWLGAYVGYLPLSPAWHGHEMIFGFATAALAGFLMAAVPNWTGRPPLQGQAVAALFALWLVGRVAMALGVWSFLDLLFLPALATVVAIPILATRNTRNYQVVGLVAGLAVLNGVVHLVDPLVGLMTATLVIAALITLIGGRIVPTFTQNALRLRGDPLITCSTPRWLGTLSVPLVVATAVAELIAPGSTASGALALAGGVVLLAGMRGWQTARTLRQPIVWILHVGYVWLPVGLLMKAAADLGGWIDPFQALHALSTGAIGVMILAVASRAALGHSGRPLVVAPPTVVAYGLVIASAIVRVVASGESGMIAAALLWTAGYGVFSAVYAPILTRRRVDGRPG